MASLTPLEIRKKEFRKVLRGFDPEEVQVFLEMVSDHYEELQEQNRLLLEKVGILEARLSEYEKNEQKISEMLAQAKQIHEETASALKMKEENIIREAELKAMEMMETARQEVFRIREEARMLQEKKNAFVQRLQYLLQSYMDLIQMINAENILSDEEMKGGTGQRAGGVKTDLAERIVPSEEENEENFVEDIESIIENLEVPDGKTSESENKPDTANESEADVGEKLKESLKKLRKDMRLGE